MTVEARILRALERGPLFEGALHLIAGGTRTHFYRVLTNLANAGRVVRDLPDNPQAWRLP